MFGKLVVKYHAVPDDCFMSMSLRRWRASPSIRDAAIIILAMDLGFLNVTGLKRVTDSRIG